MQQEQGLTIENANARNQANIAATAAAIQQRQQQQQQQSMIAARQSSQTPAAARQSTSNAAPVTSPTPPSSAPISPQQPTCTVMNNYVQGTTRVESDGWVTAHLTNISSQLLYVSWAFKKNGVPDGPDAGGGVINPGQTVGGEGGGIWSTNADKNLPEIYWYAVLKSDEDAGKPCSHHRW